VSYAHYSVGILSDIPTIARAAVKFFVALCNDLGAANIKQFFFRINKVGDTRSRKWSDGSELSDRLAVCYKRYFNGAGMPAAMVYNASLKLVDLADTIPHACGTSELLRQ